MGKIYNATGTPIVMQSVGEQKPIDDRSVVGTLNDLFDQATFSGYTYHGMLVCVVNDGDNNGLYMLQRRNNYMYQNFDENEEHYSSSQLGWMRISGNVTIVNNYYVGGIELDTSTANEGTAPGSFSTFVDTDDDNKVKYYASSINGGEY